MCLVSHRGKMQLAIKYPDNSQSMLKLSSLSFTQKRDTICLGLIAEPEQLLECADVFLL
jgi:hypothetical protein